MTNEPPRAAGDPTSDAWQVPSGDPQAPKFSTPQGAAQDQGAWSQSGPGAAPSGETPSPISADRDRFAAPDQLWPGPIPLRPLGFGDIIESAFRVLRFNPRTMFGMSFVVLAAATALSLLIGFLLAQAFTTVQSETGFSGISNFVTNINSGFLSFVTLLLSGVLIVPISEAALGRKIGGSDSWSRAKSRLLSLVGYGILSALIVAIALIPAVALFVVAILALEGGGGGIGGIGLALVVLLLTIPAILLLQVAMSLAPAAIVLEGRGPISGIRRSFSLIKGGYWRAVGIIVLVSIMTSIVMGMLMGLLFVVGIGGVTVATVAPGMGAIEIAMIVVTAIATVAVTTLVQPITSTVTALIYLDRRFRTEGLAVDLMAEADRQRPE